MVSAISLLRRLSVAILVTVLSGCASISFDDAQPGRFSGSLFVMWVGEGNASGDGLFLFVPDPNDPLTFSRKSPKAIAPTIRPGIMYTDGGSIPKLAQVFKGLSPWGYAPAYMIHDWLFTARHCLVDGENIERFKDLQGVDFDQSALILGEAIQTLIADRKVQRGDLAGNAITAAVDSAIARRLWDEKGACAGTKVKPEHIAAAEQAIPGSGAFLARTARGNLRSFNLPVDAIRAPPVKPAKLIMKMSL